MPVYVALWLVALGLGGVVAPSGAFPLSSLRIAVAVWLGAALVLGAGLWHPEARKRILTALGQPLVALGLGMALWTLVRWNFHLVPYLGRDLVIAQLWFAIGLAGAACGTALMGTGGNTRQTGEWAVRLLTLAAIAAALHGIYQYCVTYPRTLHALLAEQGGRPVTDLITQSQIHILRERRVGSTFADPNIYGGMLSALLVFCVAGMRRGESYAWRLTGGMALGLGLIALYLTRSRGGWLSALAALMLAGVMVWRTPPKGMRVAVVLALLAMAVPAMAEGGLLERIGNISTIRERLFYWAIAVKVWLKHPLVGDGPGSFAMWYPMLKNPMARESQFAHSWLFQTQAETGLAGLALALGFWFCVGWRVLQGRGAARWFALAAGVMALNGLVQFTLQQREMALMTGMLAGAAAGLGAAGAGDAVRAKWARRGGWSVAMVIVMLVCCGYMSTRTQIAKQWGWIGQDAMQEGDLDAAQDAYKKAKRWQPDDMMLELSLADVEMRRPSISMAWPHLDAAAKVNPLSSVVRARQAEYFMMRGDADAALARMDDAIRLYPSRVAYRLRRARWHLDRGETENARADLRYIEENRVPVWEYEMPDYEQLRAVAGMTPTVDESR